MNASLILVCDIEKSSQFIFSIELNPDISNLLRLFVRTRF